MTNLFIDHRCMYDLVDKPGREFYLGASSAVHPPQRYLLRLLTWIRRTLASCVPGKKNTQMLRSARGRCLIGGRPNNQVYRSRFHWAFQSSYPPPDTRRTKMIPTQKRTLSCFSMQDKVRTVSSRLAPWAAIIAGANPLQVCLITGGARGLGLEFARAFVISLVEFALWPVVVITECVIISAGAPNWRSWILNKPRRTLRPRNFWIPLGGTELTLRSLS